jgi:hypothetical protein
MKNFAIAAALIAASFSALAEGEVPAYVQTQTSNVTRAEVQFQAIAALARGELGGGE